VIWRLCSCDLWGRAGGGGGGGGGGGRSLGVCVLAIIAVFLTLVLQIAYKNYAHHRKTVGCRSRTPRSEAEAGAAWAAAIMMHDAARALSRQGRRAPARLPARTRVGSTAAAAAAPREDA
jgi:hypothetical protein